MATRPVRGLGWAFPARARGRRGGRLHDGRAASDRRAGVDDVGKLDAEEDALRDVSGSAPDAFGAAARRGRDDAEERTTYPANGDDVADVFSPKDSTTTDRSTTIDDAGEASRDDISSVSLFSFPWTSVDEIRERWRVLPSRYRVLLGTTCAFVLCNMDKVNISVAIIPMAKEMGGGPWGRRACCRARSSTGSRSRSSREGTSPRASAARACSPSASRCGPPPPSPYLSWRMTRMRFFFRACSWAWARASPPPPRRTSSRAPCRSASARGRWRSCSTGSTSGPCSA